MKRLVRMAVVALPLMMLAAPASAEVKTREKTQVKLEGMLGRVFNLFGGKGAKEGVESRTAVKGNRKASLNDNGGTIVDLSEEKVYELDAKKKQYTVTTFDEIRRKMREAQERAKKEAEKESGKAEPAERPQEKPTKEFEVDFNVQNTDQRKQIAGYDARNAIVTVTVREKGRKLEESGGLVMTNNLWLGPQIPELKELAEFEMKYWKQLQGPQAAALSAEQMSAVLAMYPLVAKAMERMQREGDKLSGTPLESTMTFEAVLSDEQLKQAKEDQQKSGGGGIGGLLAKKLMKKEDPKQRATIFTTHHEFLDVSKTVTVADLAIPADYKEKK